MAEANDSAAEATASNVGRAATVWQKYVQECLEFSNTVIRAGARVGNAWVESSAELSRGGAQAMGHYVTRVGETAARAMEPATGATTGALTPAEIGLEFERAYLNAWIQSGEAVRSAARRFLDLCLADKPG